MGNYCPFGCFVNSNLLLILHWCFLWRSLSKHNILQFSQVYKNKNKNYCSVFLSLFIVYLIKPDIVYCNITLIFSLLNIVVRIFIFWPLISDTFYALHWLSIIPCIRTECNFCSMIKLHICSNISDRKTYENNIDSFRFFFFNLSLEDFLANFN